MNNPILKASNIAKFFGKNKVLKDISIEVNKGDVISIIGSSGSGKSTLLRCLNLLETPTRGTMEFNDKYIEISFNQKNVDSFFKPSASSGIGGYGLHLIRRK
jgi:ABC-type histidine transport system ATPase subunit